MPVNQKVNIDMVSKKKPVEKSKKIKRKNGVITLTPSKNKIEVIIDVILPEDNTVIVANVLYKPFKEFIKDVAIFLDEKKYNGKINISIKYGIPTILIVKMLHAVEENSDILIKSLEHLVLELITQYRKKI